MICQICLRYASKPRFRWLDYAINANDNRIRKGRYPVHLRCYRGLLDASR